MTVPPPSSPETRIGEVVDERYRIVEFLGGGAMASVYRAEQLRSRAPFAIKVLRPEFSESPEVAARFQREALASRRIQHPNVVAAADFGKLPDNCFYMVLEYIRGEDLSLLLERERPLHQVRAVRIALQVAEALVAAHACGVIHRDLKPSNVMLLDHDFVKVVDFGIAKLTQQRGQPLTALGSVFGTPEYMAPEQARGIGADHRTDLYALGIVIYEMLVGRTPFVHDQLAQIIMGQISKPPTPLPAVVDPELAALVMQLLAKSPAERVQSASELVARLRHISARLAGIESASSTMHVADAARGANSSSALPALAGPPPVAGFSPVAATSVVLAPESALETPVVAGAAQNPAVSLLHSSATATPATVHGVHPGPPSAADPAMPIGSERRPSVWLGLLLAVAVLIVLALILAWLISEMY